MSGVKVAVAVVEPEKTAALPGGTSKKDHCHAVFPESTLWQTTGCVSQMSSRATPGVPTGVGLAAWSNLICAPGIALISYTLYLYGMPSFKELDPEVTRKLLEGHEDVLTPAVLKQDEFYRTCRCPRCGKSCQKEFVKGHTFSDENNIAPRSCLRCTSCKCLFDPHSGLVLENAG